MPINTDVILERMKLKGQVRKWRFAAIIIPAVLLVIMIGGGPTQHDSLALYPGRDFLARISVRDIIQIDHEREEIINEIAVNDHVKAVVLYVDSPGGTVVGGESLYNSIKMLAERKPVVTVMGEMATSAAYMITVPTKRIFAHKGSLTGSIGVILQSPNMTELAKKIGVSVDTITTGEFKDSLSPFKPMTPAEHKQLQELIDSFYEVFIDMVAQGRSMQREEVKKLADGRVFTGVQAISNRLVDELGNEQSALDWLAKNEGIESDLEIRDIPLHRPASKFEEYFATLSGKIIPKTMSLHGLLSIWQKSGI